MPNKNIARWAFIPALIVGLIVFIHGVVDDSGLLRHWQKLPPLPQPGSVVVQAGIDSVVVRSDDGMLYSCSSLLDQRDWPAVCWQPIATLSTDGIYSQTPRTGCTLPQAWLPWYASPQLPYRSCLDIDESYIDMSSHFVTVIDDTGTVWRWFDGVKGAVLPGWIVLSFTATIYSVFVFMAALIVSNIMYWFLQLMHSKR